MTSSILFPSQMFEPRKVDDSFEQQWKAAREAGFPTLLVHQELLDEGSFSRAVRAIDARGTGVYRGWMLTVEQYCGLYRSLAERGISLINSPEQYRHCHFLPESFELIRTKSPAAGWTSTPSWRPPTRSDLPPCSSRTT